MAATRWRSFERLAILREIDQAILEARSPGEIAQAALRHVRRLVPCLGGAVAILDLDRDAITVLVAEVDNEIKIQDATHLGLREFPWAHELICALQKGQVHLVQGLGVDLETSRYVRAMFAWGLRALLNVPMIVEGKLTGVFCLGAGHPGPFTPEHIELAREVARSLAIAVHQARLLEQVQAGRDRLQQLARQLVSAQEGERRRLARALHDEAGQALTALRMSLEGMRSDLPDGDGTLGRRLGDAAALAETTLLHLRRLAQDLRPPALDTAGLDPALEGLCRGFAACTRLAVTYSGWDLSAVPEEAQICLYRFLQEALTNVARHARAHRVSVVLGCDDHTVSLAVEDDGRGFERKDGLAAPGWSTGIGLLGMQERLESIGGRLEIASQPGRGARLVACVPWQGG
jgi:signal transduction histidine kinase